ncbi:hypothetical protein [Vibrio chagasii]|uniref:hypothetical protein n=1 Tax=Vibrio chagasii TaxID=170679 RepID=UPI00397FE4CF
MFFKELSKTTITAAITAAITVMVTLWVTKFANSIPYLDKFVLNEQSIISKDNLLKDKVKISISSGGEFEEVDKISKLSIYLVNYSNKYFQDLEVLIRLKKSIQIFSAHGAGENFESSLVDELENNQKDTFRYNIKAAKRTEKTDEFFQLVIYYKGEAKLTAEDVIVTPVNSEARIRVYDEDHRPFASEIKVLTIVGMAAVVLVFVFVFNIAFARLGYKLNRKSDRRYAYRCVSSARGVEEFSSLTPEQIQSGIISMLHENRVSRWERSNWFIRLLDGYRKPTVEDYQYDACDVAELVEKDRKRRG